MAHGVCLLAPEHAEALEQRNIIPNCSVHDHISHGAADSLIGLERDEKTKRTIEGWGEARTVLSVDGRRRITPIAKVELHRSPNKMKKPHALHYEIPAVGDHRIRWYMRFMVSERLKART